MSTAKRSGEGALPVAAYCTPDSLALYLERDLSDGESDGAPAACLAATDYIDRVCRKSWQGLTVSGEIQKVYSPQVWLNLRPVASVTSVTARSIVLGETPTVLVAGTGYELLDAANGVLLVNEWAGTLLTVTYTVSSTIPAAISLAANIIAAAYAVSGPALSGQARGIQKLEAGTAKITYDPISTSTPIPPMADALLDAYLPSLVFA